MRRRTGYLALVAIVFAFTAPARSGALPAWQAQEPTPRSVILILSDDHRYDFMSFVPGAPPFLQTPNLDRMAKSGAHIQNAFVTTALCSPSRASILTGQYAHRHGIVDNISRIRKGTTFFPQLLQKAGYRTAYIGKWHMGEVDDGPQPGFDHWVSFRGQGTYVDPTLNVNGKRQQVPGYTTDILTDRALDWLKQQTAAAQKQPFFMVLGHKAVHSEFVPAPRHKGRYGNAPIPYPETMADTEANYKGKPRWVKEQRFRI
jgi:N-acetylglucosamine-6-sulfatase